jgi:hypothetical protein
VSIGELGHKSRDELTNASKRVLEKVDNLHLKISGNVSQVKIHSHIKGG